MTMKYEFGSKEWLIALHGVIAGRAGIVGEQFPELSFSAGEVYTDAPRRLGAVNGRIAWYYRLRGKHVEFGTSEKDDLDYIIVCDYTSVVTAARFDVGSSPPDRQAEIALMASRLTNEGKTGTHGTRERFLPPFR